METIEIQRKELNGAKPLCYGYKAVKWDGGTKQRFRYGETGEKLEGKIFRVDGDINACNWGLHFSKDPANVFNFYEPLGYNRYFKIAAYENIVDTSDGLKTVAQCIEFVEEYDLMQFINLIKQFDRSGTAVSNSNAVRGSTAVDDSTAVNDSAAVSYSAAVNDSNAVSNSNAVSGSYGIRNCRGVFSSLFCSNKDGISHYIFNKKSNKSRVKEVLCKIREFNWIPEFSNWYGIKGNKEWWAFCFPQLQYVDNDIAWSKIPPNMLDYIKALPEFNEAVWKELTKK